MNSGITSRGDFRLLAARLIVGFAGIAYTLTALALIFVPRWFFENIGPFAPFNRHYEGDLGTFLLPLGVGLLLAAPDPARNRLMVGMGAATSLLHTFNHVYDAIGDAAPLSRWLTDVAPLALFALLLALPLSLKAET